MIDIQDEADNDAALSDAEQDALLKTIIERQDEAETADSDNREQAELDIQFVSGKQWPDDIRSERESDNRPVITENRLPQFVRQIVGDMRAQQPAIKVIPDGNGASQEVAKIYTGLIRDIEAKASTKRPYTTAGGSAARCGIGHWRILHDYENDKSFDQCIKIEPIDNPFAVLWDPLSTEITRQDARYCFVTSEMSEDDFVEAYPDAKKTSFDHVNVGEAWIDKQTKAIRIAEYWYKKTIKKKLIKFNDGFVAFEDEITQDMELMIEAGFVKPVDEREIDSFEVVCIKTNGQEILEPPKVWPTKHIPIIPVVGEEYAVGEKRVRHSAIRFARDPQQIYNYWLSTETEQLALQPKAPFIATPKQVGAHKTVWQNANVKNHAVLLYTPDKDAPGAPQRAQPPVSSPAIAQQVARAADAMKATTGIYDAGLGARGNETSGKAILARQRESDVGTSEFLDNLSASIAYTGEIIVDLIPKIYDTERQISVLSEDGTETFEEVNKRMMTEEGEKIINALDQGKYAVKVTTGPSYTTRRQEAAESMLAFVQANPQSASIVMDLIAQNMDWPGAEQFAERFKKSLPPELRPEDDDPEQQQAQAEAMRQKQAQEEKMQKAADIKLSAEEAKANKSNADAARSQAEAEKTQAETASIQLETALKTGRLDSLIQEIVAQQVRAIMQQATTQPMAQPAPRHPQMAVNGGLPLE